MNLLQEHELQQPVRSRARGLIIAVTLLLAATTALTVYVVRLKHRAEQMHSHGSDTQAVAPPVSGPKQDIPVLIANDADGQLHQQSIATAMPAERSDRARQTVHVLLEFYQNQNSPHPLAKGADVKSVFIVGNDLAVIDCNSAFADAHRSGILVEELTIASIADTVAANVPGIARVKFLVEGKERDTLAGHADLKSTYDVAAFSGMRSANDSATGDGTTQAIRKEIQ